MAGFRAPFASALSHACSAHMWCTALSHAHTEPQEQGSTPPVAVKGAAAALQMVCGPAEGQLRAAGHIRRRATCGHCVCGSSHNTVLAVAKIGLLMLATCMLLGCWSRRAATQHTHRLVCTLTWQRKPQGCQHTSALPRCRLTQKSASDMPPNPVLRSPHATAQDMIYSNTRDTFFMALRRAVSCTTAAWPLQTPKTHLSTCARRQRL